MLYDAKEGGLRSGKGELSKSDVGEQKSSYLRKCWTSIRTTRELIVLYYEYPKGYWVWCSAFGCSARCGEHGRGRSGAGTMSATREAEVHARER